MVHGPECAPESWPSRLGSLPSKSSLDCLSRATACAKQTGFLSGLVSMSSYRAQWVALSICPPGTPHFGRGPAAHPSKAMRCTDLRSNLATGHRDGRKTRTPRVEVVRLSHRGSRTSLETEDGGMVPRGDT